ncbi:MAG: FAD-dependent oxidoreductase [Bacilli bacterium]|nr:FAD-dependent oxidoreductase [Bacilli bacterium]
MSEQNTKIKSKYEGEQGYEFEKEYKKLAKKITDVVVHKITGIKTTDPEYWGLREVLTIEMVRVLNKMKLRKFYTFEELLVMNKKEYGNNPVAFQKLLDDMSIIGILEYDYGDRYEWERPRDDLPKIKRYRLCFFVPGSAELMNSTVDRIAKNPPVASFFERMTFIPLAGITQMLPPGGDGVGMHVIPVEKAIEQNPEAIDVEKISHWMKKYDGHIAAGICSCRASRAMLGEGCVDDVDDWCIQFGDMADYAVETGRAHYITKERALEIFELSEKNGFVHQITNIDGENKIFDICNCDVKICNALRTSMLFNTPNLSRSSFTANVDKINCVACGQCVENCPAGAVKLGQKLCDSKGKEVKYPKAPLPDKIHWGKYAWDENYRSTARRSDTYESGTAPCKVACPAHVPVQGYLKKAHEGKYQEALALIKTQNPFPAVCGRVCNKRCEMACTRGSVDRAVSIDAVKKFVADFDLKAETQYIPEKIIANTHGEFTEKIAIIGAGPAGLSAAYYLAVMGFRPTVFEKNKKPGGMLMYGIPSYKLEKDVIEAEIDIIKKLGVEIKCGVEVGKDITIDQLKEQGYKAFYIAIGCQGGKRPGIKNDDAKGTEIAVDYLRDIQDEKKPFKGEVVVVGGGNVAVDCARSAHRLGANKVSMFCLEDRETMPASKDEIEETLAEGILIENSWGPKEIKVNSNGEVESIIFKRCVSTVDPETGKFSPRYDEDVVQEIKADKIVFAIGQEIVWGNLLKGYDIKMHHGNYPLASMPRYQTSDPDIFVGGDVCTGPKFVIDAIAAGHAVADSLARHVRPAADHDVAFNLRGFAMLDKDNITIPSYDTAGRQEEGMDDSIDWKNSFKDAHKTLTEEQVKIETARCLSCGAAHVDPNKCIGCGICTTKCKFDAIHLVRDHPKHSNMRVAEKKVGGLAAYALPRAVKILFHSGSKEARMMRKKRKEWKKNNKEFIKNNPNTGNSL